MNDVLTASLNHPSGRLAGVLLKKLTKGSDDRELPEQLRASISKSLDTNQPTPKKGKKPRRVGYLKMKVVCPNCGKEVTFSGLGRPRTYLDGIKVLATLRANGSVTATAKEYAVSRGIIRNAMKGIGLTTKDIIKK